MNEVVFHVRSPLWIFLVPGLVCALLWLVAPVDFIFSGSAQTIVLALLMPLLLLLGMLLGFRRIRSVCVPVQLNRTRVRRAVYLVALLGFAGLALRLFERIFLRAGGAVTSDFMANREMLESGGSGLVSLIAGILVTFLLLLPFFCLLLRKLGVRRWRYTVLLLASLFYPVSDILLQGSRSTLVVYVGVALISWLTLNKLRIRLRFVAMMVVAVVGLAWLAAQVFVLRTTQMGMDPVASMYLSGYAHFAPASVSVIEYLERNELAGGLMLVYAYVHFCQYLLHGIYELFYILSEVSIPSTYGLQSFYIPIKVLFSLYGGPDMESVLVVGVLRPGVYTTLFGPLVYDFGPWGALLACLVLGFGVGALVRRVRHGSLELFPLYIMVLGFLPFAFVVNLFVSGTGQYALLGSVFLAAFLSTRWFRLA